MPYKILVVDDDPGIISIVADSLNSEDIVLFAANNGESAYRITCEEKPELIILDWQLPAMDGLTFLKKVKEKEEIKDIIVIMMTGIMTDSSDLISAYQNGATDFLRKPIVKTELNARVRSMLLLTDLYKEKIEQKNKELINAALKTIETNELIGEIHKIISAGEEVIGRTDPELHKEFTELKNKISFKLQSGIWKQFEDHFLKINPDFYSRILIKHPDLTKSELKLCALLRLNLDSKEIASILCQEYDSVRVSRTRLRKKLNLANETNLVNYLIKI